MTPARAVEVAALFEDSVISVRHLTEDPRGSWSLLHDLGLEGDTPRVTVTSSGWSLSLGAEMQGELQVGAAPATPLAAGSTVELRDGMRALIDLGALRFIVQTTDAPSRMPTPLRIDWVQESYTIAVGLAVGLFLSLLQMIPPDPKSLALDTIHSDLVAHYVIKAPEPPAIPSPKSGIKSGSGGGQAIEGPRGAMGRRSVPPNTHAAFRIKGNAVDPKVGKLIAADAAAKSGIIGALAMLDASHIGSVFAREHALGADAEDAMGDLIGTHPGDAYGNDGLDLVGGGPGGGGHGTDTIGMNTLGRIGPGGPGRPGWGPPTGSVELRGHKVGNVNPFQPPIIRTGSGLDKALVQRVVRAHHNEIKFCYERRLLEKQSLSSGRVVTRFTIAGNGRVVGSNTETSTLNDAQVESCIAEAVRRWDFPKPTDGSVVVVSYPFVLQGPAQ